MDIVEAVKSRKSIRGYKPDPVPKEILWDIIETARYCPSALNTQPWEIHIVTGEVLDNIKRDNIEMLTSGMKPSPEAPSVHYEGIYKQRQVDNGIRLFQIMGITRDDRAKRAEWEKRGFRFFDAPVGIILTVDKSIDGLYPQFDIGAIVQTICLTALNYGLGTCIMGQGIRYPEVIRKYVKIPESSRLAISISMGYPDWDFPANEVSSAREQVENIAFWHGFD